LNDLTNNNNSGDSISSSGLKIVTLKTLCMMAISHWKQSLSFNRIDCFVRACSWSG